MRVVPVDCDAMANERCARTDEEGRGRRRSAALQGAQTYKQFVELERLDYVIVRSMSRRSTGRVQRKSNPITVLGFRKGHYIIYTFVIIKR